MANSNTDDKDKRFTLDEAAQIMSNRITSQNTQITALQQAIDELGTTMNNRLESLECGQTNDNTYTTLLGDIKTIREQIKDITDILQNKPQIKRTAPTFQLTEQSDGVSTTPEQPYRQSDIIMSPLNSTIQTKFTPSTIIVPPISSFPTFSGKPTDRPRQFLLRVTEYTRTVNKWSVETLLQGISQFLKDSALEWYCQLYITNTVPRTWDAFTTRFMNQFHSPVRLAQQEHEWDECKQLENETINEFVVRLRSLWIEQKPDEEEADFIKHLFCKMRTDMLTLMNASRSASLEEIINEAQQVEEILYLRNKETRSRNNQRNKPTNQTPLLALSARNLNQSRSNQYSSQSSSFTPTCYRCYETGHYSTNCPLNENGHKWESTDNYQQPLPQRPKNM